MGVERMGTCRKWSHIWSAYPPAIEATVRFGASLNHMEPVDLCGFLGAPDMEDALLQCLLADVWESAAVTALTTMEFIKLPREYSAAELQKCFHPVFLEVVPGWHSSGGLSGAATRRATPSGAFSVAKKWRELPPLWRAELGKAVGLAPGI